MLNLPVFCQRSKFIRAVLFIFGSVVGAISTTSFADEGGFDYPRIVEQVEASVVTVLIDNSSESSRDSSFERKFFETPQGRPVRSSGFVFSADGYIVTVASGVSGRGAITVVLAGGRRLPAKFVAADSKTDIALLKAEGSFKPVQFAEMRTVKTGQRTLLVGSAYDGIKSVADGLISTDARIPNKLVMPYLTSSVPLQPGNGGAPLFNNKGEVIGMVTLLYVSPNRDFSPVTFAVPADAVRTIIAELRDHGYVSRGAIGVAVQEVPEAPASSGQHGALVQQVRPGGAADKAGIKEGDVIVRFNDEAIDNAGELSMLVGKLRPGTKVPIRLLRAGKSMDVVAELDEQEKN